MPAGPGALRERLGQPHVRAPLAAAAFGVDACRGVGGRARGREASCRSPTMTIPEPSPRLVPRSVPASSASSLLSLLRIAVVICVQIVPRCLSDASAVMPRRDAIS